MILLAALGTAEAILCTVVFIGGLVFALAIIQNNQMEDGIKIVVLIMGLLVMGSFLASSINSTDGVKPVEPIVEIGLSLDIEAGEVE